MIDNTLVEVVINSLNPARYGCDFKYDVVFNQILMIDIFSIFCENSLRWMVQDVTDGKSSFI